MSGSHSDSIQLGGAYDGALGVIGAIAALKALREAGFKPLRSLEALMFSTEEAGRFNVPCLGRCAAARALALLPLYPLPSSSVRAYCRSGGTLSIRRV